MKKIISILASLSLIFSLAACGGTSSSKEDNYPSKDIQGSVMWSAGGVCDITSRSIGNAAQAALGKNIIFTNRPGSGGGISTAYVSAQNADGYELLFGAENPQIAKVMGTSELDYDDFTPITLFCTTYAAVCVSQDSPYNTINELIDDILANPDKIIMATTGAGGLPETVSSMMTDIHGTKPVHVSFDGENEALTAVMGKNADYSVTTLGSAASFYEAGNIKILAMVSEEPVVGYEDVPAILSVYPDYAKYLPWGPFYGVFVKKGTDEKVVAQLSEIFSKATENQEFQDLLATKGCFPINLTGDEAVAYLEKYRSVTSWLLFDSGVAKKSPEEFGIARP